MWCCSVAKSYLTLCNPVDLSRPDFPVLHCLLELLKLMSIVSMMPYNHLILCHPRLLFSSVLLGIRVFSNTLALHIRGQRIGSSASSSVLPMNIQDWFPLGLAGLISLESKGLSRVFTNTTVGKHQFFSAQHVYGQNLTSLHDYWKNHSFE